MSNIFNIDFQEFIQALNDKKIKRKESRYAKFFICFSNFRFIKRGKTIIIVNILF